MSKFWGYNSVVAIVSSALAERVDLSVLTTQNKGNWEGMAGN